MKQKLKHYTFLILLAGVFILFLRLLVDVGFFPSFPAVSRRIASFQSFFYSQGVTFSEATQKRINTKDLVGENLRLQSLVQTLLVDTSKLELLKEENRALREQLEFQKEITENTLSAHIIGTDTRIYHNTLMIDKGSLDGVQNGLPVIVDQGIIIGKIVDVKESLATILLLTDNKSKLAVTSLNRDRTIGMVEGELGISLQMNLIPQSEEINIHDIIVTSGLESGIPRGLVVGTVREVITTSNELFISAKIEIPVHYYKSTIVTVILPPV